MFRYNRRYAPQIPRETNRRVNSNPWSEEELKLPRYMRSTASSRQRLKENMESGVWNRPMSKVFHRKTMPVLYSSQKIDKEPALQVVSSKCAGEEISEQRETRINIEDEVPIETDPIPETSCVAIKKRMSSCSCLLINANLFLCLKSPVNEYTFLSINRSFLWFVTTNI